MHDLRRTPRCRLRRTTPALEIEPGLWSFLPPTPERRQLLDVGGGSGAIAIELCRACPD